MAEASGSGGTAPVLPPNEKTVYFEKRGSNGKMLTGDFTFKRLTLFNVGRVGAELARLNGGNPVDKTTEYINNMMAYFKYAITKAPDWWKPDQMYEGELMREVFEAILAHEDSFRPADNGPDEAPPPAG